MFDKIKDALWESNSQGAKVKGGVVPPQVGQPVYTPPGAAPVSGGTASFATALDQEMLADIQRQVAARSTPFTSLEEKAQTLVAVLPDETTRIRAAFQLLKADGKSADAVITSIDLHVRDVNHLKAQTAAQGKDAAQRKSGTLRQEVTQMEQQNANATQQIASLEQQINQLRQQVMERTNQIMTKSQEADAAERDIQMKVDKFNMAADHVINTLNTKKMTLSSMLA